jgi:hypothetical protein
MVRKTGLTSLREGELPAAGAWDDATAADWPELRVHGESELGLFAEYTQGDPAGAVEYRVEVSPVSSGDDWFPAEEFRDEAGAATAGQSTRVVSRTRTVLLTGTQRAPMRTFDVSGAYRARVVAREVGAAGTPGAFRVRARGVARGA